MKKKFTCIIPVRYESSRFPGKPLAKIAGKAMIEIVYKNATKASYIEDVVVAAYGEKMENYCKENNIKYIRVSDNCKNGSEAVADVARSINKPYIFEMQGDQPLVTPDIIDDFLKRANKEIEKNSDVGVVIPYAPAIDEHTNSTDVLKVVKTESNKLVFQTRQPVQTGWRTLGLYLWKHGTLLKFAKLPVSDIERIEDSHPIRLYINDVVVQGILIESSNWVEVDRPNQIKEVEDLMKKSVK